MYECTWKHTNTRTPACSFKVLFHWALSPCKQILIALSNCTCKMLNSCCPTPTLTDLVAAPCCSCLCLWNTVFIFNSWVPVPTPTGDTISADVDGVGGAVVCGGGVVVFLRSLTKRRFFMMRSRRSSRAATFISCNLPSRELCRRCTGGHDWL